MPYKILLLTTDIDFAESNLFVKIHQAGHQIIVVCDPDAANRGYLETAGVPVVACAIKRRFDNTFQRCIQEILQKSHFDIIHVLRKPALLNVLRLKSCFPDSKLVAYRGIVGNLSFLDPLSWMTFLNPRIDKIICVAEAIRQHFLKMRFLGYRLPPHKFVTVHKGHDISWYAFNEKYDLSQLGIETGEHTIGCVASMRPRKGGRYLVKAFDQLAMTNVWLVIVGDIKDKQLTRAIESSPNRSRIIATGFRRDARQIAGAFDVFVLPSIKREGLPRSVIEAMSQGVPAIVTDSGGSPEVVENEVTGLVVPPANTDALASAMKRMLTDDAFRNACARQSPEHISKNFNIELTVKKTLDVYRCLLEKTAEENHD